MSQQINLFNPLFLREERYFSARTMVQALALVLVGLGAFYAYGVWQTRALEQIVAGQTRDVSQARARVLALSGAGAQDRVHALQAQAHGLEAEIKARRALLGKLSSGELANSEGVSRYLAAFSEQALAGVWLTGFTVGAGGNDLQVYGRALAPDLLPTYLRALSRADVMQGRQVVALQLNARASTPPPSGTPGAGPMRFVEFSFSAPLRISGLGADSTKEAAH